MKQIQIIVEVKSAKYIRRIRTYKFSSMEAARAFVAKFNLEDKIIDILA